MKSILARIVLFSVLTQMAIAASESALTVKVQGTVKAYSERPWNGTLANMRSIRGVAYIATLEITNPSELRDPKLEIRSITPLAPDHLLRKTGALVSFTTSEEYLAHLRKDSPTNLGAQFLHVDRIVELREIKKVPNLPPEPTAPSGRGSP